MTRASDKRDMMISPLEGIRIIDLTQAWAGTLATCLLADMGADVIKIESRSRPDTWRGRLEPELAANGPHGYPDNNPGDKPYNRGALFHGVNRNKKGITLDLTKPEGVVIFKDLVKTGDVVAENFTPRVMGKFGLDYHTLKEVNPSIVMISMPGYGMTGPYRDSRGVGGSIEPMSGMSSLMGYADRPPMNHGTMYPDPIAGMMGAAAILIALHSRKSTGAGQYIDLSQQEATTIFLGEALMDYSMNKRVRQRQGNRHPFMAPHQNYRCRGEDEWIAISITSDKEWAQLVKVMEEPAWAEDEKFETPLARLENEDALNRHIEAWTAGYDKYELMDELQRNGVPAGAVLAPREVVEDLHLEARDAIEEMDYAESHRFKMPGIPWKMSKTPGKIRCPAPRLGQDSESVLSELLNMSHEEYQHLVEKRVSGEEPIPPEEMEAYRLGKIKPPSGA